MFGSIDLSVIFLFGIEALLILILVLLVIKYTNSLFIRTGIVILFLFFLPFVYTSFTELLGRPKPITLMWVKNNLITDIKELDAEILAASLSEGTGIFLYLRLPKQIEPLSLVLPWNLELAEQLQDRLRGAKATRSKLYIKLQFELSFDITKPMFYEKPQPPRPSKDAQNAPLEYQQD